MDKEKLAYWTGLVQTDGSLHKKKRHREPKFKYYISMHTTTEKSLPMLRRFQKLSEDLFDRCAGIFEGKRSWDIKIGASKLLEFFEEWDIDLSDPPVPPQWSLDKDRIFGAYLAGVIDGDGDIRVKRPEYPQCAIRISSGDRQKRLRESLENMLGSKASVRKREEITRLPDNREKKTAWFVLEFYVSQKNYEFVKEFILPHITLDYKKQRLASFIQSEIE